MEIFPLIENSRSLDPQIFQLSKCKTAPHRILLWYFNILAIKRSPKEISEWEIKGRLRGPGSCMALDVSMFNFLESWKWENDAIPSKF